MNSLKKQTSEDAVKRALGLKGEVLGFGLGLDNRAYINIPH